MSELREWCSAVLCAAARLPAEISIVRVTSQNRGSAHARPLKGGVSCGPGLAAVRAAGVM